jgi:hypothetical protein
MLRVGFPVTVIFDLTDGSKIALNSCDATEWLSRDPVRYSRTDTGVRIPPPRRRMTATDYQPVIPEEPVEAGAATDAKMDKQVEPQVITGTLVNWNTSGVPQSTT